MKKELTDFQRAELFEHYNSNDNPFLIINTKIDITNIYNNCKNYYASIGYYLLLAANKIENFKIRYEDGKFYYYDKVTPNFTDMMEDKNIGFFSCDLKDDYESFIKEYKIQKEDFLNKNIKNSETARYDEIWLSCVPWFQTTCIVPPYNKNVTIPQLIWDKFNIENDRCYVNLTIMVHHGFVDGYHIANFLEEFNNIVSDIKENNNDNTLKLKK